MIKNIFTLVLAIAISLTVSGQQTGLFGIEISFQGIQREMYYSVPANYDSSVSYPLVIVLHGCGQQASQIRDDFAFLSDSINAIVVAPQGPEFNDGFFLQQQNEIMIKNAYDSTAIIYNIDNFRIYLLGFSCNGLSTLVVGTTIGQYMFKGIIPISATVSEANMQYINFEYEPPVCICVGAADVMAVEANTSIRDQFIQNGGRVLYLETPMLGHDYFFDGYESKTMSCFDFIDNPLEINKIEYSDNELEVYPNPANSYIAIRINRLFSGKVRARIFNVKSQCVYDNLLNDSTINVEFLESGIYFIQIIGSNTVMSCKFIKN